MTVHASVETLEPVPVDERARLLAQLGDLATHAAALEDLAALNHVELRQPPVPAHTRPLRGELRIASWNAERGTHLDEARALLAGVGADVNLLCELDVGMARSDQRHTPRDLAEALGHGYAYGVEFLELGLGNRWEREALDGAVNEYGYHGAAVTTATEIRRPMLLRLDRSGVWFTTECDEPRVGGRMAIAATLPWDEGELVVASAHVESHGDPAGRAEQMERLLRELDAYAGERPVVLGGDFNTFSAAAVEIYRSAFRRELLRDDPERFNYPVRHEPLFDVAARHGYEWKTANAPGPTQRTKADGYPNEPLMRLDWLFLRGASASGPETVAAVDADGVAISDHDLLAVTIR